MQSLTFFLACAGGTGGMLCSLGFCGSRCPSDDETGVDWTELSRWWGGLFWRNV